ncbi:YdhR family protein [Hyphomicrobium sp. CS1BSMeth3]|uniref:YdhR family protein n=1 Tax=Hyphomicrobium sp. CS1BSMeth3 TaxID=1892844 RepID=UPI000B2A71A1|nr:YdhR family protein [Hyphomicrobium sp. CS1BSMeth3]
MGSTMITAIVRYRLPLTIDRNACRWHFWRIAPGFSEVPGLISKHFIWSPDGTAGGVYQWESRAFAEAFYSGPWRKGIVDRYGVEPTIEYFEVFSITDNANGVVRVPQVA